MKKFFKVLFCIILIPIMLAGILFKGLIGLADSMERGRRRNSRHYGVMSSSNSVGARGGKRRR